LFRFRLSLRQRGTGLGLQRVLRDVHDFKERGVVGRGEIGNDLAVELALGGNQAFDETAVSDTSGARGGIDARLPEIAIDALLGAAVAVGVLTTVIHGVGRVAVKFGALEAEALRGCQHSSTTFAGSGGVGNAHCSSVLNFNRLNQSATVAERHALRDAINVRGVHDRSLAEAAEALGVLGLCQVTAARVGTQNLAGGGDLKPLRGGFLGLDAFGTTHKFSCKKGRKLYAGRGWVARKNLN